MKRHGFDSVSFLFGLIFTALAVWVLFSDDIDIFDARWVWPTLLIVGGAALLVSMFTGPSGSAVDEEHEVPR